MSRRPKLSPNAQFAKVAIALLLFFAMGIAFLLFDLDEWIGRLIFAPMMPNG